MSALPPRKVQRHPLSALTRYGIVPLLLLALGVRLGMSLERRRAARVPVPLAPAQAASPAPVAAAKPAATEAPSCEMTASFQNNIYPSLMLSFGVAYPEYARCLTVNLRGLPPVGDPQLRIDSDLFLQPLVVPVSPVSGAASINPELPWNYDALRRTTQMEAHTFVASLAVDGKPQSETPLVCTVHSVNEAVSRIFMASSGQWQDTSVCFAAFVNEDHPMINALLQEAMAGGSVRAFTGYQYGAQSALQQAQAVWDALAARGLSYVNMATDSGTSPLVSTQYVRFLDQSIHDRGANCVDASVLFASVLRRIGLRPVLLFRPGHCFTGFYDAPEGGHIVAFETSYLGSGTVCRGRGRGSEGAPDDAALHRLATVLRRRHRALQAGGDQSHPLPGPGGKLRSGAEEVGDRRLDLQGLGAGVGGLADGAADDDVVRAADEGVARIDGPLLVVGRPVLDRTDPGAHDEEVGSQLAAQAVGLEARRDDAVAAELDRPPGPGEDELRGVALESQVVEVPPVEAREDRDGEYLRAAP